MESESDIKKLKKELEGTKSALKLQTIRCRQLVAAFTKKLQEKESELRMSKDLRDQQLSCLLRALLILESRLRKEQKQICKQLHEKDLIIQTQYDELCKLKGHTVNKVDMQTWTGDEYVGKDVEVICAVQPNNLWVKQNPEDRLDDLCTKKNNDELFDKLHNEKVSEHYSNKQSVSGNLFCAKKETENCVDFKKGNDYIDNPVLECVNQILLRDEEELLKPNKTDVSNTFLLGKEESLKSGFENTSNMCKEWYETDTSLTVQEEPEREAWCISIEEEDTTDSKKNSNSSLNPNDALPRVKEKLSPVPKAQHFEEKVCLEMSKKHLTIAHPIELEEVSNKSPTLRPSSPSPNDASYQEIVCKNTKYQPVRNLQKPPALPPKPARLLKPHQILQNISKPTKPVEPNRDTVSSDSISSIYPIVQINSQPTRSKSDSQLKSQSLNILPRSLTQPGPAPTTTNHTHPPPVLSRKYLSTGNLKANEEKHGKNKIHLQEIKRNQMNGHIPGNVKAQEKFEISHYETRGKLPTMKEEPIPKPSGTIKVGSSVSSLIIGTNGESIVTELMSKAREEKPETDASLSHVSHLVKQFEVLGKPEEKTDVSDDIRTNFEEFNLDESYVESIIEGNDEDGRLDGDGAVVNHYGTVTLSPPPKPAPPPPVQTQEGTENRTYEAFLETTGLSQKSILTPSRMLTNHRSCLKPKDVKHRSRVKAAAVVEKCNNISGSTIKYWTEPFL